MKHVIVNDELTKVTLENHYFLNEYSPTRQDWIGAQIAQKLALRSCGRQKGWRNRIKYYEIAYLHNDYDPNVDLLTSELFKQIGIRKIV